MGQLSMSAAVDVDLDGTRVATWVMEPPAGIQPVRDIVICHGTPWSSTMWAATAQLLSAENRVHLWDMPGYGASIDAAAPASDLISQRRRLTALLDHWALDTPHIIAHDIGGAVALGAHLLDGVEFASLYLADVVTLEPWGSPFFQLVAEHEAVFSALPPQLHAALVREYIAGAAGPHLDTAWIETLATPWLSEQGAAAFYRQIAHLSPEHTAPIVEKLHEVACPVHIAWGEEDPWIPVNQAARLAQLLTGHPMDESCEADAVETTRAWSRRTSSALTQSSPGPGAPGGIRPRSGVPAVFTSSRAQPSETRQAGSDSRDSKPLEITYFAEAGHLLPLEAPEEFHRDVAAWLGP